MGDKIIYGLGVLFALSGIVRIITLFDSIGAAESISLIIGIVCLFIGKLLIDKASPKKQNESDKPKDNEKE